MSGGTHPDWDDLAERMSETAELIEEIALEAKELVVGPEFPEAGKMDPRRNLLERAKFVTSLQYQAKELWRMAGRIEEGVEPSRDLGEAS